MSRTVTAAIRKSRKLLTPPDPEGMNDERAHRAAVAVKAYKAIKGVDPDCLVRDLLSDLRHFCDRNRLDFGKENAIAADHYYAEIGTDLVKRWNDNHPDTDEHRAGCQSCMMTHDRRRPD